MDLFAGETIRGPEPTDRGDDFVLKALPPFKIALIVRQLAEQLAYECAYRRVSLRGLDARSPIDVVRK